MPASRRSFTDALSFQLATKSRSGAREMMVSGFSVSLWGMAPTMSAMLERAGSVENVVTPSSRGIDHGKKNLVRREGERDDPRGRGAKDNGVAKIVHHPERITCLLLGPRRQGRGQ